VQRNDGALINTIKRSKNIKGSRTGHSKVPHYHVSHPPAEPLAWPRVQTEQCARTAHAKSFAQRLREENRWMRKLVICTRIWAENPSRIGSEPRVLRRVAAPFRRSVFSPQALKVCGDSGGSGGIYVLLRGLDTVGRWCRWCRGPPCRD
jgi:hypothetical protein